METTQSKADVASLDASRECLSFKVMIVHVPIILHEQSKNNTES